MAPLYVQEGFTIWLPAGSGNNTWISGVIIPPGYANLHSLDPYLKGLPQQFYIVRAWVEHQTSGQTEAGGEFVILVDRNRRMFNSSSPPYYQNGDHSRNIGLASIRYAPNDPQLRIFDFAYPVYVDLGVDSIFAVQGTPVPDSASVCLGILAPGPGIEPAGF